MDSIYIKHPIESCNIEQALLLSKCNDVDRKFHAQMFNYGNATFLYHKMAEPTKEEYVLWLEGLPENIRLAFTEMGYEKSKTALPLTRFANEIRDNGIDEYLKKLLKPEDYQVFIKRKMDSE
jgi:hypothetical protein